MTYGKLIGHVTDVSRDSLNFGFYGTVEVGLLNVRQILPRLTPVAMATKFEKNRQ